MARIVVALDPAVTSGEESDETGIIVYGKSVDGDGFVLDDQSGRYQPNAWAQKALELYRSRHADRIVAEVNNGGDLVQNAIRMFDKNVAFKAVHATRGRSAGPNRSLRCTKAALAVHSAVSGTSARFPSSKTRCVNCRLTSIPGRLGIRPIGPAR